MAVCREVSEGSTLQPRPRDITYLDDVRVVSDRRGKPVTVHAMTYLINVPRGVTIKVREGGLVSITKAEIKANLDSFTHVAKVCF